MNEFKGFKDRPFREFLQSKQIPDNLQPFLTGAIAIASDSDGNSILLLF